MEDDFTYKDIILTEPKVRWLDGQDKGFFLFQEPEVFGCFKKSSTSVPISDHLVNMCCNALKNKAY